MKYKILTLIVLSVVTFTTYSQNNNGNGNGNPGGLTNVWTRTGNTGVLSTEFLGTNDNTDLIFKTNLLERMRILGSGNIGIGTATPLSTLDLTGTFRLNDGTQQAGYFLGTDANGNAAWVSLPNNNIWNLNGNDAYYTAGRVGIGTSTPGATNPNAVLEVKGRTVIDGNDHTETRLTFTNAGIGATQFFWDEPTDLFNIQASRVGGAGINFIVRDMLNQYHDVLNLNKNTNVGIKTNQPNSPLTVAGTIESTTGGIKFPDGTVQTTAATVLQGSSVNPYTDLFVSDYLKVGNNSIHMGSANATSTENEFFTTNGPLIINSSGVNVKSGTSEGQNTIINPNGGRVGIGHANISTGVDVHVKGKMLLDGINSSMFFGDDIVRSRGQYGIEYEKWSGGLNFWKPFGSTNSTGGGGFQNFILFLKDNGNVGVGTSNPKDAFQLGDNEHKIVMGSAIGADLDFGTMYLGFNAAREAGAWSTNTDGAHNGGAVIFSDISGGISFANIETEAVGSSNQTGITDLELRDKTSLYISKNGNVSIGTKDGQGYKLAVKGHMIAEEIVVKLHANWPDFVFTKDYGLMSLDEVASFIEENNHLPNIPSANKVSEEGINLGEMDAKLLQKIEELTLYVIQLKKENERQQELINDIISGK